MQDFLERQYFRGEDHPIARRNWRGSSEVKWESRQGRWTRDLCRWEEERLWAVGSAARRKKESRAVMMTVAGFSVKHSCRWRVVVLLAFVEEIGAVATVVGVGVAAAAAADHEWNWKPNSR